MSEVSFRIEQNSKAFEILANNLYQDKILAVIRELCCNAQDAHVESGNPTKPFEVHIPTYSEMYFSVRDYGNGLSSDQIEEIFTVFFASTKTGSSAFTGSFGLGAKTPFALVNQFEVVSYQNKTQTSYICKKKNGTPVIELVNVVPTEESDGLKIRFDLPAKDFSETTWKEKARSVFDAFKIAPNSNISFTPSSKHHSYVCSTNWESLVDQRGIMIQMGNVRYPLDVNMIPNFYKKYKNAIEPIWTRNCLVVHVPQKSIEITPSREGISYDENTVAFLEMYLDNLFIDYQNKIQKDISEITSRGKLISYITKIRSQQEGNILWHSVDQKSLTYQGSQIINTIGEISIPIKECAKNVDPEAYGEHQPSVYLGSYVTLHHSDTVLNSFKTKKYDTISSKTLELIIPNKDDNRKEMKVCFVNKDVECEDHRGAKFVAMSLCSQGRQIKVVMVEDVDAFCEITGFEEEDLIKLSTHYTKYSKDPYKPVKRIPKKDPSIAYRKISYGQSINQKFYDIMGSETIIAPNEEEAIKKIVESVTGDTVYIITSKESMNKNSMPLFYIDPTYSNYQISLNTLSSVMSKHIIGENPIDNLFIFRQTNAVRKFLAKLRTKKRVVNLVTEVRNRFENFINNEPEIKKIFMCKAIEINSPRNSTLEFIFKNIILNDNRGQTSYFYKKILCAEKPYVDDPAVVEFQNNFYETFGCSFSSFIEITSKPEFNEKFQLLENITTRNNTGLGNPFKNLEHKNINFFHEFLKIIIKKYQFILDENFGSNNRFLLETLLYQGKITAEECNEILEKKDNKIHH